MGHLYFKVTFLVSKWEMFAFNGRKLLFLASWVMSHFSHSISQIPLSIIELGAI